MIARELNTNPRPMAVRSRFWCVRLWSRGGAHSPCLEADEKCAAFDWSIRRTAYDQTYSHKARSEGITQSHILDAG